MGRVDGSKLSPWTTRRLLVWTTDYFCAKGLDSPRLAAEMLLAHVLGVGRLQIYTDHDRPASDGERAAFRDLVERAAAHEPVDYLTSWSPFFSLNFRVTPAVLIPRPSTETIVEHLIQHARSTERFRAPLIVDIGTGSGAIAIAVVKHLKGSHVIATDISAEALEVAGDNARREGVNEHIEFHLGDLLEAVPTGCQAQYLVSNPPYVSDEQWDQLPPNVRDYEPHLALHGGPDGLDYIRRIVADCAHYLASPGQLLVEIADTQGDQVLQLAAANEFLCDPHILDDHESLPRVLVADRC